MLIEIGHWYSELLKTNPVIGGIISVWAITVSTLLLRWLPKIFYGLIVRNLVVSVSISNATGHYWQEMQYRDFLMWFSSTKWFKFSKSVAMHSGYFSKRNDLNLVREGRAGLEESFLDTVTGPGLGTHIFFDKGKLYWFVLKRLESSGAEKLKEEIIIYTFGLTNKTIIKLGDKFALKFDTKANHVFNYINSSWELTSSVFPRSLETVIMDDSVLNSIKSEIEFVTNNRKWYIDRGFAPKSTIVLYGSPGGGKTSLIRALASHYNRNIYSLNLSTLSDISLAKAISSIPKNSFLLIEDFEGTSAVQSRQEKQDTNDDGMYIVEKPKEEGSEIPMFQPLTISGVLNAFDGIIPIDGVITFMTTNHLEQVDAAVLRSGRVDLKLEITALTPPLIKRYIAVMYPEIDYSVYANLEFCPIMGCELHKLFSRNKFDGRKFISQLSCTQKVALHSVQ